MREEWIKGETGAEAESRIGRTREDDDDDEKKKAEEEGAVREMLLSFSLEGDKEGDSPKELE